jgi:hypothetical protein
VRVTHTEWVHVLFGIGLVLMALLAIRAEWRPGGMAASAWPALAMLIGLLLFVPVEAHTRTYMVLGWMDVLRTLVPDRPAHWLGDWLVAVHPAFVLQHKVGGAAAMLLGSVELARARGFLLDPRWRYILPACILVAAASFGLHGGTTHHLPFAAEQRQHHVMGVAFAISGLSVGLHRAGILPHRRWALVWPVLALVAGISLVLFYRLPPGAAGHPLHAPPAGVSTLTGGER